MDLPSLHKLFQMALETGHVAKVRDIFQLVILLPWILPRLE